MAAKKEVVELASQYWDSANPESKALVQEFLQDSKQLSSQTIKQYQSALKIWLCYLNKFCNNICITEAKKRDLAKFQLWLHGLEIYEANIRMKRSAISSFNEWVLLMYDDIYPDFRNFVSKGIKVPETGKRHEKEPLTDEEFEMLVKYLERNEEWQTLAWFVFTYTTGCRKNESAQLLKEVVKQVPVERVVKVRDENGEEREVPIKKYKTNPIKCKGKESDDKKKLSFDENTMFYLMKWLKARGEDECPYMFIAGKGRSARKPEIEIFNRWCTKLEDVLGRRLHPHLLRSSRATSLYMGGKNIEAIQALLGHKSSDTTRIYIINDNDDEDDEIFA